MYYFNSANPTYRQENSAYLTRLSLLWGEIDDIWGDSDVVEQELYTGQEKK